ncbi:hypothetical protein Tco_0295640 [Tanacetum coccineum]
MPIELGSFDVIIWMDSLSKYHAVIVCDEKLVRLPYSNETLTNQGDRSESRFNIISCIKHRSTCRKVVMCSWHTLMRRNLKKSRRRSDLRTCMFLGTFQKSFPRLPPTRQVKFQIDLVPEAALVARVPYRLAPSEMQ